MERLDGEAAGMPRATATEASRQTQIAAVCEKLGETIEGLTIGVEVLQKRIEPAMRAEHNLDRTPPPNPGSKEMVEPEELCKLAGGLIALDERLRVISRVVTEMVNRLEL